MTSDRFFKKAVEAVLSHEGGYRNRASDPGGETKFGITARSYPKLHIKSLTREQAVSIYKADWWDKYGYERFGNYFLGLKVFDLAVNIGPGRAHRFLQEALNEVTEAGYGEARHMLKVDGVLGPLTFEAANYLPATAVLVAFLFRVQDHYEKCAVTQPDELKGWKKRLRSIA